jgi:hydrogenase maturation protease
MGDDGFGPKVVELLSSMRLPEGVEVRDIGTAGLTIATDLEEYDAAIFLDSMEMEGEPGSLSRLRMKVEGGDVEGLARLTLHEVGLEGLLRFADALGVLPREVYLIGCKPKSVEPGIGLSPEVEEAAHKAVKLVLKTLRELRKRGGD